MRWFNRAEKGEIVLERLVLSGHSNGVELWGDAEADAESKPGTMVVERDLRALTTVFPDAGCAGRGRDVLGLLLDRRRRDRHLPVPKPQDLLVVQRVLARHRGRLGAAHRHLVGGHRGRRRR